MLSETQWIRSQVALQRGGREVQHFLFPVAPEVARIERAGLRGTTVTGGFVNRPLPLSSDHQAGNYMSRHHTRELADAA